jgi:pimeloyl-ACP methyl ester carboxylesterase
MAKIYKHYVETDRGLIHMQEAGNGPKVLAFINITSWGRVLMDQALPLLADRGYRALNIDIMGYGRSDKRDAGSWRIEDFADNIQQALDGADAKPMGYVAGHMAGLIGIEFAHRASTGAKGLVIEGTPIIPPETREANRTNPPPPPTVWSEDGTHAVDYWKRIYGLVKRLDPAFELPTNPSRKLREIYITYLEVGCFEPSTMFGVAHYEVEKKLSEIELPTLVMCSDTDWNLQYHPKILGLLKNGSELRWKGTSPLHNLSGPDRSAEYVDAIDTFFAPLIG